MNILINVWIHPLKQKAEQPFSLVTCYLISWMIYNLISLNENNLKHTKGAGRTPGCYSYHWSSKPTTVKPFSKKHLKVKSRLISLAGVILPLCRLVSDPLVNQMVQHRGVLGKNERSEQRMLCYWSQLCS